MKKIIFAAFVAVWVLSGCGVSVHVEDDSKNQTTLFLVDEEGFSYGDIPYKCDSMSKWSKTASNGAFTFFPPDNCQFDFRGLDGNYDNDPESDEIIRITDDLDKGVEGISYECTSSGTGKTLDDGSFYYDMDDECLFYL
ncbi:hypothetical protein MNB_SV-3-124 [hydrothermal vent metagenome]|uniref:Lipoprotein n=1 Tax=hydrothermal vent metagenome TaxID=652676 RepID=A0A1W1CIF1_9ZZZZ